jgi:formate dehydrogenase maturation protein FdhE
MTLSPHLFTLIAATLAVGWMMAMAGLGKSALELKRRRRICPSCGRTINGTVCRTCV